MRDFFAFRRMITGVVIQIVFVLGLIAIVIAAIGAIANDQAVLGFVVLIFGALYWRILCEVLIVIFRMNDSLTAIRMNTVGTPAVLGGAATTPVQAAATPSVEPAAVAAPALAPTTAQEEEPATTAAAAPVTPETAVAPATPAAAHPPAGWYDDSQRPGHKRWWDGTDWGIRDDEHPSAR